MTLTVFSWQKLKRNNMYRAVDKNLRDKILGDLEERFGLDKKIFEKFLFFEATKGRIFITSKIPAEALGYYIQTLGQLFCRLDASTKPSTNMIQIFGKFATKNVLSLTKEQTKTIIEGFDLELAFSLESISPNAKDAGMSRVSARHEPALEREIYKTEDSKHKTESLPCPKETNCNGVTDGYVILKYKNFFLGCGLLKEGKLKNMIPKAKRIRVDLL